MRNKAWGAKIANETLGKGYVKVPLGNGKAGKGGGTGGGANTRAWFVIGRDGTCETMEAGKHAIMKRTGLPGRDLRMLEPSLSYPSTILGREKAIVFNVEHIKAIITCTEILLLNSRDPLVSPFAHALVRRLSPSPAHSPFQKNVHEEANMGATNKTNKGSYLETNEMPESTFCRDMMKKDTNGLENGTSPKVLPFEFRALEACLEASCSSLDVETTTLEKEAYPALDELTTSTSTLNLERVRQIKSRLVAISGRVQKVRDELEHLLDDDGDMAEMYLTNKFLEQQLGDASFRSFDGAKLEFQNSQREVVDERDLDGVGEDDDINTNTSSSDQSSHGDESSSKHFDVEELEMLLEAYFVQIDGTLNKLSALREYVDDTEDYINIMLDDKQNQLLQMGVVLSTSNLLFNCAIVVVGLFGMNINIELFEKKHAGLAQFSWTVAGTIIGGVVLYIFAMSWWRKKGLLE